MARSSVGVWFLVWGLSAQSATAGEVNLDVQTKAGYDSNIFNRNSRDVAGDIGTGVFTFRGTGVVSDTLERGSYRISATPSYSVNEDPEAKNTWNHAASAEGAYHFSPRTSVNVSDNFHFLEKILFAPDDPDLDANFDDENRRTLRNQVVVGATHAFAPRVAGSTSATYDIYRYSRDRDPNSDSFSGRAGMSYALTPQIRVGGGGSFGYRVFEGNLAPTFGSLGQGCGGERAPNGRTVNYSGYASVNYQIDDQSFISVQAGPARIESSNFRCIPMLTLDPMNPTNPPLFSSAYGRANSSRTTWFASTEIARRWQFISLSLRYSRDEGIGSAGDSSVNDGVIARVELRPADRWRVNLRGGYQRRDSAFGSAGSTSNSYTASAAVGWRLLKHLSTSLDFSYRQRDQEQTNVGDFDSWRATAGLKYEFEPIRF